MSRTKKIDLEKMRKLLQQGRSQRQIAREFNVSDSAISQRMKNLNVDLAKNVQLESAHAIVLNTIDCAASINQINQDATYLLNLLMAWIRGEGWAIKLLKKHEEAGTKIKFQDPKILAVKLMEQIQRQLRLQIEILNSVSNFGAVADFQRQVIDIVGELDIETRKKFVNRLKEKKYLRSSARL